MRGKSSRPASASPLTARSIRSIAEVLSQVFPDKQVELLSGRFGDRFGIGDERMFQRRSAFAFTLGRHATDGRSYYPAGVRRIFRQVLDDLRYGNGIVIGMPAVIVGDHGDGDVADLPF